jgi:hypothetical protein
MRSASDNLAQASHTHSRYAPASAIFAAVGVRGSLCRKQSDLRMFSVRDRSRLSEILAAVSAAQPWTPPLPERCWAALSCTPLDRGHAEAPGKNDLEHTPPGR